MLCASALIDSLQLPNVHDDNAQFSPKDLQKAMVDTIAALNALAKEAGITEVRNLPASVPESDSPRSRAC